MIPYLKKSSGSGWKVLATLKMIPSTTAVVTLPRQIIGENKKVIQNFAYFVFNTRKKNGIIIRYRRQKGQRCFILLLFID